MESSRRQQAQADLGMDFAKEDQKREAALAKDASVDIILANERLKENIAIHILK